MSLFTFIGEPYTVHDILVLLLSFNALADNILINTLPLSDSDCRVNPLLVTFGLAAEILLTLKEIATAEVALQVKLTVELRVILTDWGLTVISI